MSAVSMMKQRSHMDVVEEIFGLVNGTTRSERVGRLREFAIDQLKQGCPRQALLEDFESVRSSLEDQDRDAEEDDVVAVMDALTGYCSPAARI